MEVVTIEHEAFQEMKKMFFGICDKHSQLLDEHVKSTSKMLSVKEVADLIGVSTDTILRRKLEIGYVCSGRVYRFGQENVENWMRKNSIKPKIK